jgi:hypothetical protein
LLHSSTALRARVQRLVTWKKERNLQPHRSWLYALPAAAAVVVFIATYGSVLNQMHAVTEWLVR